MMKQAFLTVEINEKRPSYWAYRSISTTPLEEAAKMLRQAQHDKRLIFQLIGKYDH